MRLSAVIWTRSHITVMPFDNAISITFRRTFSVFLRNSRLSYYAPASVNARTDAAMPLSSITLYPFPFEDERGQGRNAPVHENHHPHCGKMHYSPHSCRHYVAFNCFVGGGLENVA
jgi:hypothetical protein